MSAPSLTIDVEPVVGGNAVYLPLAAATPGATAEFKLVLALRIRNQEPSAVTVSGIRYAFPGSNVTAVVHVLPQNNFDDGPEIAAGAAKWWSNGVVKNDSQERTNVIYLPQPAPGQVRVEVSCEGFSDRAKVTMPLAAHAPDVKGGGYHFPICTADLADDERLVTSARHWANGGPSGTQIFAHDLDVQRWDPDTDAWTNLKAGAAGDDDSDDCGWGTPIRAMAAGVVAEDPVDGFEDTLTVDDGVPGVGNHVWITHGSERMLYPHLRNGSIPVELAKGTSVYAGQMIGRMGSSGRAGGPHVHMECRSDASKRLRPIVLRNASVADRSTVIAPGKGGAWVPLARAGVPRVASAIWPESTTPSFRIPAIGIARDGDWGNTMWISGSYDAFSDEATALHQEKGRRLIWVSTYVEDGKVRFVGIARDGDWGNTLYRRDSYQAFADKATALHKDNGRRLTCVTTYVAGGKRWFVGIARDGSWANTLYRSDGYDAFADKATALHKDEGRRLICVATYLDGATRRFVGIARDGDWGNTLYRSDGYDAFADRSNALHKENGRRLTCATTYVAGGKRWFVGIARSGDWGNTLYRRGDLDSFRLYADQLHAEKGRRLSCAAFFDTA